MTGYYSDDDQEGIEGFKPVAAGNKSDAVGNDEHASRTALSSEKEGVRSVKSLIYFGDTSTYRVTKVGKGYNSATARVKILQLLEGEGSIPIGATVVLPTRKLSPLTAWL